VTFACGWPFSKRRQCEPGADAITSYRINGMSAKRRLKRHVRAKLLK
jgi:hypothetical protein